MQCGSDIEGERGRERERQRDDKRSRKERERVRERVRRKKKRQKKERKKERKRRISKWRATRAKEEDIQVVCWISGGAKQSGYVNVVDLERKV